MTWDGKTLNKFYVAAVGALGQALVSSVADGHINSDDYWSWITAVLTAIVVLITPNYIKRP